jgi:hypothetical protein
MLAPDQAEDLNNTSKGSVFQREDFVSSTPDVKPRTPQQAAAPSVFRPAPTKDDDTEVFIMRLGINTGRRWEMLTKYHRTVSVLHGGQYLLFKIFILSRAPK